MVVGISLLVCIDCTPFSRARRTGVNEDRNGAFLNPKSKYYRSKSVRTLPIERSEASQVIEDDKTDSLCVIKPVAWARLEISSYAKLDRCSCIIYRKYCDMEYNSLLSHQVRYLACSTGDARPHLLSAHPHAQSTHSSSSAPFSF